jgi:hypothetical protein
MIEQVNENDFIQRFSAMGRQDNFSYDGLKALFAYFEQLEEEIGEPVEFDCIAICCEYSEYDSLKEFQDNYGSDYETMEDIENETTVIKIDDDRFIIQDF